MDYPLSQRAFLLVTNPTESISHFRPPLSILGFRPSPAPLFPQLPLAAAFPHHRSFASAASRHSTQLGVAANPTIVTSANSAFLAANPGTTLQHASLSSISPGIAGGPLPPFFSNQRGRKERIVWCCKVDCSSLEIREKYDVEGK